MAYVTDREGGGSQTDPRGRLLIPTYNQLADDAVGDIEPLPARQTDCGEECVSMVLYALTGVYHPEGSLRRQLGLPGLDGRTTAVQLRSLFGEFGISATPLSTSGRMRNVIRPAIAGGCPVLCLGRYVSPAVLHWVVCVDYGGGRVGFNDPWGGVLRYETWPWFQRASTGEYIQVDKKAPRVK